LENVQFEDQKGDGKIKCIWVLVRHNGYGWWMEFIHSVMEGFGISGIEPWSSATTVLVNTKSLHVCSPPNAVSPSYPGMFHRLR